MHTSRTRLVPIILSYAREPLAASPPADELFVLLALLDTITAGVIAEQVVRGRIASHILFAECARGTAHYVRIDSRLDTVERPSPEPLAMERD